MLLELKSCVTPLLACQLQSEVHEVACRQIVPIGGGDARSIFFAVDHSENCTRRRWIRKDFFRTEVSLGLYMIKLLHLFVGQRRCKHLNAVIMKNVARISLGHSAAGTTVLCD